MGIQAPILHLLYLAVHCCLPCPAEAQLVRRWGEERTVGGRGGGEEGGREKEGRRGGGEEGKGEEGRGRG